MKYIRKVVPGKAGVGDTSGLLHSAQGESRTPVGTVAARTLWTVICVLAILLTGPLHGADPWEETPYSDWSADDASKVLNDSPWVKQERLNLFTQRTERMNPWIQVTWVSYPVRYAITVMAREAGHSEPDPPRETSGLQFFVRGPMLTQATDRMDAALAAETHLRLKDGTEIPVADVQFGPRYPNDPLLILLFPRVNEEGEGISPEDKEVELRLQLRDRTLKVKYKLNELMVDGQLEVF